MSGHETEALPDHSIGSEQAILATVSFAEYVPAVEASGLTADDFYVPAHRIIYQTIIELFHSQGNYDPVIVANKLEEQHLLEAVGGYAGLMNALTKDIPQTIPQLRDMHIAAVRDAAKRRRAVAAIDAANNMLKRRDMRGITALQDAIATLQDNGDGSHQFKPFMAAAERVLRDLEAELAARSYITGIRSGYYRLDALTAGFQPDNVYIFAARPSMGKTALALNFLQNMVLHPCEGTKVPHVAFISAEMSSAGLFRRLLSSEAGVNLREVVQQGPKGYDLQKVSSAFRKLKERGNMDVLDAQGMDIDRIASVLRYAHQARPFDIVFLDYLQLVPSTGERAKDSTVAQVEEISRKLHALAMETHLPFVVLAQVNRDAAGKMPALHDLKGSGSIEQDADVVVLLDRPEKYLDDDDSEEYREAVRGLAVLDVAKNRNGETGKVLLDFDSATQRFIDRANQTLPRKSAVVSKGRKRS